ncbi:hypothetical protein QBC46DRAFT_378564 [Diplogelasinospora grovesii]|uniref:U3 small nucleolar RNA-associated protein 10 n=1 Tax=Diplogelasinospora grovesii TaxID=303347 RepID=A0AAN6NFV8_9PEZI|nr:hypothetical protein QBC46DRAFT_378564 [Diplogelasinospora grovesii]
MAEAVNGMLDKMRSGRKSIQAENDQALLQQIVPVLSESLVMKDIPGIQIASYMIVAILASKGSLDDAALSAFMDQLVHGWTSETFRPGLVCLCILSQYRSAKQLSGRVTKALLKVPNLTQTLHEISRDHRVDKLANGLALALVDRLHKKGDVRSLPVVTSLLLGQVLQEKQIKVVYKTMLVAAHKVNDEVDQDGQIRKELGLTLVRLSQAGGDVGDVVRAAIEDIDFNIEELELRLGTAIRPKLAIEQPQEDVAMNDGFEAPKLKEEVGVALDRLAKANHPTASCLSQEPSAFYHELCSLFMNVATSETELLKFDNAPVLSRPLAPTKSFYLTFYTRIWCEPFPTLARMTALERVKERLKEKDCAELDFQAIIPYCIVALSDPAKKVRRAAADLITVLGSLFATAPAKTRPIWGATDLYEKTDGLTWLDFDAAKSLIHSVLLPSLEEAVLHEDQVLAALTSALEKSGKETDKKRHLSHATRLSVFKFLSSHVIATPLLNVRLRLLKTLNQIRSISGTSRTDLLLPLLRSWADLSEIDARHLAELADLEVAAVDAACVDVVVPNHELGLETLIGLIREPRTSARQHLLQAIFTRIRKMFPSMKGETQLSTARTMLSLSQAAASSLSESNLVATEASDLLRNVDLSANTLLDLLDSLQDSVKLVTVPPANKRRRVSTTEHSRSLSLLSSPELSSTLNRTTFVLELVQESKPENHPELLPSLFTTLSDLQQLRALVGSELGYLQNLVLSSLLAMIPAYKNNKDLVIDASLGYGDVLATCIQRSSSPTVINAALLLVASLARTAPDVVLHSVMPIFTFMGSSVLRQADDYSAHVVNQTVKEVIPPLIDTFRKSRRNLVASTAELLSSFVIAYEHIPSHRKHDLFISLIENLGPEDFLFALLAMFVDKYGATDSIMSFLAQIMASFSVEIQLQTLIKLLDLISDIFKPKPSLSAVLLGKNENAGEEQSQKIAMKELALLPLLLGNRRLKKEITLLAERDDMESAKIRDLYATLLENLLTLATTVKAKKPLYNKCGDALSSLLNLLSISEFIKSVESLLDRPNVTLRQKVLRALEVRVDNESTADPKSRIALLAFLPQLTAVIRESDDINYKHTAVTCVDKIAEKYGKKDLEAVAAAATTIASDHCLGQPHKSLRVMALLCLASLVDVLQDGIVPVLPLAIPKALGYLEESLGGGVAIPDTELHNAAYALMTSLAQHIPYMISGAYLDRLLSVSTASAYAGLDEEANSSRSQCLQFLAKLVHPKSLFVALNKNWEKVYYFEGNFLGLAEYLQVLGTALDKHSKSVISKNISTLSTIFFNTLDLRRARVAAGEKDDRDSVDTPLTRIETTVNETLLKMIYKLNDAAFRPIFSQLVEWSSAKDAGNGVLLRQHSVYGFLGMFFDNLKSIVTSYASYIIEDAAKLLASVQLREILEKDVWTRVLFTLKKCFEHDQDGFWQAPAHFNAVAPLLVKAFEQAPEMDDADGDRFLIPAIVELAAAADAKEHHKELNQGLLRHLRSEQAAERIAVIKCQQALTDRLGEEWLANLPEMLPYISELQDDDHEIVERENRRWIVKIEETLGESLDSMLQ